MFRVWWIPSGESWSLGKARSGAAHGHNHIRRAFRRGSLPQKVAGALPPAKASKSLALGQNRPLGKDDALLAHGRSPRIISTRKSCSTTRQTEVCPHADLFGSKKQKIFSAAADPQRHPGVSGMKLRLDAPCLPGEGLRPGRFTNFGASASAPEVSSPHAAASTLTSRWRRLPMRCWCTSRSCRAWSPSQT